LLVLQGNGTAYDLDSLAPDWDPIAGHTWIDQNIAYVPDGDNGKPLVQLSGSPATDVVMSGKGPWTYQQCSSAPYGENQSIPGPNVIAGAALDIGRGICVETQNAPLTSSGGPKTDGGHYAVLVVKAITPTALTLEVTVWP
jgi:hypothetical protein